MSHQLLMMMPLQRPSMAKMGPQIHNQHLKGQYQEHQTMDRQPTSLIQKEKVEKKMEPPQAQTHLPILHHQQQKKRAMPLQALRHLVEPLPAPRLRRQAQQGQLGQQDQLPQRKASVEAVDKSLGLLAIRLVKLQDRLMDLLHLHQKRSKRRSQN
jgi:hypothetical protein